jgi:hypothetical protein
LLIGSAITGFVVAPLSIQIASCMQRSYGVASLFDTKASRCSIRSGFHPAFVFGLSAISNPTGQEGLHQIDHKGGAMVLFYLGFDLAFALANSPNTELLFRVQHRSGGYGTLGA